MVSNIFETQYKSILAKCLMEGTPCINRTDYKAKTLFNVNIEINLNNGFPMITGKKIFEKNFIHELIWFINGNTNIKYLKENNVNIWNNWADENDNLGPTYGYHLRKFNGYFDQLKDVINKLSLANNRRLVVSLWNPEDNKKTLLPPCHYSFQLVPINSQLNMVINLRSWDLFVGATYDIPFYALLLNLIAKEAGYEANKIAFNAGNAHIYECHYKEAKEYIRKTMYCLPDLDISKANIFNLKAENIIINNYKSENYIKSKIVV